MCIRDSSWTTRRTRGGDFYLATTGDLYLAISGDFSMATDTIDTLSFDLADLPSNSSRSMAGRTRSAQVVEMTTDPPRKGRCLVAPPRGYLTQVAAGGLRERLATKPGRGSP